MRFGSSEVTMKAGIFYATREGQTRKIAERIAHTLQSRGVDARLYDVRDSEGSVDWSRYSMVWLAGSVHAGHHEREIIRFARRHREDLVRRRAVFVSVTLS